MPRSTILLTPLVVGLAFPALSFVCDNGLLEPGEQCDDGNVLSGDGCSAACTLEAGCGNGVVEPGEECDDHNTVAGDGCSATCQYEGCPLTGTWASSIPIVSLEYRLNLAEDASGAVSGVYYQAGTTQRSTATRSREVAWVDT